MERKTKRRTFNSLNLIKEEPRVGDFSVSIISETGVISPVIRAFGSILSGKKSPDAKHVRFWHDGTNTTYIYWYAPADLRLAVADKHQGIIYITATEKKKTNQEGREENYFRITSHQITNDFVVNGFPMCKEY